MLQKQIFFILHFLDQIPPFVFCFKGGIQFIKLNEMFLNHIINFINFSDN